MEKSNSKSQYRATCSEPYCSLLFTPLLGSLHASYSILFLFIPFFCILLLLLIFWKLSSSSFQPWRPQVFNSKFNKARQVQQPCTHATTQSTRTPKSNRQGMNQGSLRYLLKSHTLTSLNIWSSLGPLSDKRSRRCLTGNVADAKPNLSGKLWTFQAAPNDTALP